MQVRILCIGDIVGRPGRQILAEKLPHIVKEREIDCVIANAENAAGGSGLTAQIYEKLLKYGVNLITLGDHVYRKRDIIPVLQNSNCIVRPINLSAKAAGYEYAVYTTQKGHSIAIISVLGRIYMNNAQADNPYHAVDRVLGKIPGDVKIRLVDMHAEASSEKIAMGWYLNGRVTGVYGTHTHVQTADERVLSKGTAYITDLGMTGPHESVLGRNVEPVLKSLTTNMPFPYSIASNDLQINGAIITAESNGPSGGMASSIERISIHGGEDMNNMRAYDSDDGRPNY